MIRSLKNNNWKHLLLSNKSILLIITSLALLLRLTSLANNNFYFTMDQGRDAVDVRHLLSGNPTLKGPTTEIKGFHTGPLWYYFLAVGYVASIGHPVGPVIVLIALNVSIIGLTVIFLLKKSNKTTAFLTGIGLTVLQPFFETSWYAFNPHLLPAICVSSLLVYALYSKKKEALFFAAAAFVGLVIHSEVAFFVPLSLLFLGYGIYLVGKKQLDLVVFLFSFIIIGLFFLPLIVSELFNNFQQTKAVVTEISSNTGVFSQKNPGDTTKQILELTGQSTIGIKHIMAGIVVSLSTISALVVYKGKKKSPATFKFVSLTILLWIGTIIWYATNKGLDPWHLVGLPPLLFVSWILVLSFLKKKIALVFQIATLIVHLGIFAINTDRYFNISSDQSLLHNELMAVDWIYQQSENKHFNVYTFLPSVHDFPYQYLFPWYGRKKYSYLPCEYSTYPGISASSYIKGNRQYQEKNCQPEHFFLIIEPPVTQAVLDKWYQGVTNGSRLLKMVKAGNITIEKRHYF